MTAIALAPVSASLPDASVLKRFLSWMRSQPAEHRARAVNLLARTYLNSALPASGRADALTAMTATLDDPIVAVRRALAEALAGAIEAPRHIIAALAADRAEVACPVLAHSPHVDDYLMNEVIRHSGLAQQTAIARRAHLGARPAAVLAELAERPAIIALIDNPGADIDNASLACILKRFGSDGAVREALLLRGGLSPALQVDVAVASAEALVVLSRSRSWLEQGHAERLARDAREQAIVSIARRCEAVELPALVEHLRERAFLTAGVVMRALLSGDVSLFETSLAAMSGAPARRVAGFVADFRGRGFAAIYEKSGFPAAFLPAFRAALTALKNGRRRGDEGVDHRLALATISACEALGDPGLEPIVSLMWRLAGEAARQEARQEAADAPPMLTLVAEVDGIEPLRIEAAEPLAITYDVTAAIALELDLAVAEISEIYAEAPRLDFAALDENIEGDDAPRLPGALEILGVNENEAPADLGEDALIEAVAA